MACSTALYFPAAEDLSSLTPGRMPTEEFELLKNDPDLQCESGPGGTLIFLDGDSYCVIGPQFVSMEESECYAFGVTREQALANYARKRALAPMDPSAV